MSKSIEQMQTDAAAAVAALGQFPAGLLPPIFEGLLNLKAPAGYHPVVFFRSSTDRRIRRDADATNWDPKTGSVEIRFEADVPATLGGAADPHGLAQPNGTDRQAVLPVQLQDLVIALDSAEREPRFREFVGIKQFRDQYLPNRGHAWAEEPAGRHRVLVVAIDQELIMKGSVVNPRFPDFPTTTVCVNREHPAVQQILRERATERSRFHPVAIRGEPLSKTVIENRR